MSEPDRYRAAAEQALLRYPGPVGELIFRELSAYATFGRQFTVDGDSLIPHLASHVLTGSCDSTSDFKRPPPGPVLWPRGQAPSTASRDVGDLVSQGGGR